MTTRVVKVVLISLWSALLTVPAFADQCVEGDCINGKGTKI
jgi:hypothetical protein